MKSASRSFTHQETIQLAQREDLIAHIDEPYVGKKIFLTVTTSDSVRVDTIEALMLRNDKVEDENLLLLIGDNKFELVINHDKDFVEFAYKLQIMSKTGYVTTDDNWKQIDLGEVTPLSVIGTSIEEGDIPFNETVTIRFNRAIEKNVLHLIEVTRADGKVVAVLSSVEPNELKITQVYKLMLKNHTR